MNDTITKMVRREAGVDAGSFHEATSEALSSVEVGETAPEGKGQPYVKSAKAYHVDPNTAADLAVAAFQRAKLALGARS